jgi:hypothetical protein
VPALPQPTPPVQDVGAAVPPLAPAADEVAPAGPQIVPPVQSDAGAVMPVVSRAPGLSVGADVPLSPGSSGNAGVGIGTARHPDVAASASTESAGSAAVSPARGALARPPVAPGQAGGRRAESRTALAPAGLGSIKGSAPLADLPTAASASRPPHVPAMAALRRPPRTHGAIAPPDRLPGAPSAAAGACASGTAPPPAAYALLVAARASATALLTRLSCAPARWRPLLFISLLERPG